MGFLDKILERVASFWWLGLVIVLFLIVKRLAKGAWKKIHDYFEDRYLEGIERVCLEIRIPTDLEKTPLAMEQVFAGLYGTAIAPTWFDINFRGFLETTYSFEIISIGGDIHFIVYAPKEYQEVVESHLYAQFPEIEINQVEDYVTRAPERLPNEEYGMVGTELVLNKPDPYPIRTYKEFELEPGREAEEAVDPVASILETMNAVPPEGQLWVQYIISPPMGRDWRKEGEEIVAEMMGRRKPKPQGLIAMLFSEIASFIGYFFRHLESFFTGEPIEIKVEKREEEEEVYPLWKLTPGEQDVINAIERNIAKDGFYTTIRIVYFAPWEKFTTDKVSSIIGAFKQFNDETLNGFTGNPALDYSVRLNHFWKYRRAVYYLAWKYRTIPRTPQQLRELRMREIYRNYKIRNFGKPGRGHKGFIFNIEELATVCHFPMRAVETPELPRVGAKKGGPPAGLPVEES